MWAGSTLTVQGVYQQIRHSQIEEEPASHSAMDTMAVPDQGDLKGKGNLNGQHSS